MQGQSRRRWFAEIANAGISAASGAIAPLSPPSRCKVGEGGLQEISAASGAIAPLPPPSAEISAASGATAGIDGDRDQHREQCN